MSRTARTGQALRTGGRRGAVLGTLFFLALGLAPAISLGSYGALIFLAHLTGHPAETGVPAKIAVAAGAAVGAVSAAAMSLLAGSVAGRAVASVLSSIKEALKTLREERDRDRTGLAFLPRRPMAARTEADIRSRLAFLSGCRDAIHSIVVVGSAAHDDLAQGSDYDVVLICGEKGIALVQDAVFEQSVADRLCGQGRTVEYTLQRPSDVRQLFRMASPFGFAIRRGAVLFDDGCLRGLAAEPHRAAPGRKFFYTALSERILVPYYGSFRALAKSARKLGCSIACCSGRPDCPGLSPADMPATVILRMLYVTLPGRGCMPLSKEDVVVFTRRLYGPETAEIVAHAVRQARDGSAGFRYADLQRYQRLAGRLFREILGMINRPAAVRGLLADGARLVQGQYRLVRDRKLRSCVRASRAVQDTV